MCENEPYILFFVVLLTQVGYVHFDFRRDGRAVEGARLESV